MKKKTTFFVDSPAPLLEFLLERVSGQSRNSVKHLLSRNQVLVDGVPQRQFDHQLSPGQQVELLPPSAGPSLPFPVLYEDDGLLVIHKPAGLLSVATETEKRHTAYRLVSDYLRGRDPQVRLFVVHRLDRDTSGVLLFTKDEMLKHTLQDDWNRLVQKRGYWAIAEGTDLPPEGTFRSILTENRLHRVYSSKSGKDSVTHYKVISRRKGYSLLDVTIDTGRKNQIRAHLSEAGCPVAGDIKYNASTDPMGRLALHAYELALIDPRSGKKLAFTADAPFSFRKMFPCLKGGDDL